jgi:hypothetical protein
MSPEGSRKQFPWTIPPPAVRPENDMPIETKLSGRLKTLPKVPSIVQAISRSAPEPQPEQWTVYVS